MKNGLLLINLGTPDKADVTNVRKYLREFLSDPRVIDLPAPLRYLLLYAFILPFRPKSTAKAYQLIWTDKGSPLLANSQRLVESLEERLGNSYKVALGMRYGNPSIQEALTKLSDCDNLTILPLYPQYSSAATGSSLEKVVTLLATQNTLPSLKIIRDFCQHPGFIAAQAELITPYLQNHDHLLFSYHGIPERHILKGGCQEVCQNSCPTNNPGNTACYRAQCYQTTSALAKVLDLPADKYSTSFQSRLGKTPWIKPYTDFILPELAQKGIKRLAVCCPSFVSDCLETLEEIGMRARHQWQQLGGEDLTLIPCVNSTSRWIDAIIDIADV